MKKLFKTFLTIVIIFALVIIFTFAVVSIAMTGQVKAFDKTSNQSRGQGCVKIRSLIFSVKPIIMYKCNTYPVL